MAVDRGTLFWAKSLLTGKFDRPIGVRLYGTAGPTRKASPEELDRVAERVKILRTSRGGAKLWGDFELVRDLPFTGYRLVSYPEKQPASRP